LFEHDLRANAFRVCREGKPVPTFPDHALCGGKSKRQCRRDRYAGARYACAVTPAATTFADAVKAGLVKIDGDPRKLDELMSMLDTFQSDVPRWSNQSRAV